MRKAELAALELNLGKRAVDPLEMVNEHSALDKITCNVNFEPPGKRVEGKFTVSFQVEIVAELHKRSDPEPEFEAILNQPVWGDGSSPKLEEVPALGDKAYLVPPPDEYEGPLLKVLDGGAVLELRVRPSVDFHGDGDPPEESPTPDLSALPPLMIEDMRDLMTALKS